MKIYQIGRKINNKKKIMNGFFIAIIVIYILELGYVMAKHGKQLDGKYNFYATFMSNAIMLYLIYKCI